MPWRHMGKWRHSSIILDLGTRWRWVVSLAPRTLYPRGNRPRYLLDWRLRGPRAGLDVVEEIKSCSCRDSYPGRRANSPQLSRLLNILWHARCRSTVNSGNVVYNRCWATKQWKRTAFFLWSVPVMTSSNSRGIGEVFSLWSVPRL
jgi:hypothetical protein